jgi:hypothetical protein
MKVKKILKETTDRYTYRRAQLFHLDVWSRREMNRLRRKSYGGPESEIRRPNWKFQKIEKQWMVKPWKETRSTHHRRSEVWVTLEI